MMSDKYRYRYTLTFQFGDWHHSWELVGRHGGVHLHITEYGERMLKHMPSGERYSGGIEFHYRVPPDDKQDKPPDHDECWLIKCPCWHDGSSLWASEYWVPRFEAMPRDHEGMFTALAGAATRRFEPQKEDAA